MNIKTTYYFLFLTLIGISLNSCKQPEPEETLPVSVASISASAGKNTYEVSVTTTAADFTVIADSSWCTITTNVANKSFSISIAANNNNVIRKTKISVTTTKKTATISLTQAAGVYTPIVLTPTQRDSIALVKLNTGSTKWDITKAFNTWAGVKVELIDGYWRVVELDIHSLNYTTGTITDSIKNLTELQYLDMSGSNLGGAIPSMTTLSKLIVLDLKNNLLSGSIPTLPNSLSYLSLGQNKLSGTLPVSMKYMSNLMILDLGLNDLTGEIPADWSILTKLKYFYLYGNVLSGSIPNFISSFGKLEALALDYNQLTGSIPSGIGSITTLQKLTLQQNKLTGTIPADLRNNANWATWNATVTPQQNGITLSGAPAGVKSLSNNYKQTSKIQVYLLPNKKTVYSSFKKQLNYIY
jgi:hypothetical protein